MKQPTFADLGSSYAEWALIGAALLRGAEVFTEPTVARLLPSHFTDVKAQCVWEEIKRQEQFDSVTIGESIKLKDDGVDTADLMGMVNACLCCFKAEYYARVVWDFARRRRVYHAAARIGGAVFRDEFEQVLDKEIVGLQKVQSARVGENERVGNYQKENNE